MPTFKVGVFDDPEHPQRKSMAYTRWYSPDWTGCCVHTLEAPNGTDAKRQAIHAHEITCRGRSPEDRTRLRRLPVRE